MSKLTCVIASPVETFSGYGTMARNFAKALFRVKGEEWDIKFLSLKWGDTPFGALDEAVPEEKRIKDSIIADGQLRFKPDVWIQISVSNEFVPVGTVNIGYSCLVETSLLPAEMLEGLNRMNFNMVSAEHAKTIAVNSVWEKRNEANNTVEQLSLKKPVETLFIGLDTAKFKKPEKVSFDLSQVEESFCFLSVCHLLPGTEHLEDRKMVGRLIKTFLETFKDKKNKPALILKSSTGRYSYVDEERTINIIDKIRKTVSSKDLPNIYLIHGELTEQELCELYCHEKVKAFALAGNEGFGLPYIEFSAVSGKPIITSPWSGHIDFLNKEYNVFVNGSVEQIHGSTVNQFLIAQSAWFKPNEKDLSKKLEDVYKNYKNCVDNGKRQGYISKTEFNLDKMADKLKEVLDKHMPTISKPVPLNLPKLANIKKPDIEFLEQIN
jgi:glycosyltransferase involved in cell wall biosynthesis